jgi:hypothetical protein
LHTKNKSQRNLHLAGEASGSSISNGCQAKTERRRQFAGWGLGEGEPSYTPPYMVGSKRRALLL